MPAINKVQVVNYTPAQMYEIVNRVESYDSFLPWCESTSVHFRNKQEVEATIQIRKGLLQHKFTTLNQLTENQRIDMHYISGPFRHLKGCWQFDLINTNQCRVQLQLTYEFSNRLLSLAIEPIFFIINQSLITSFYQRAKKIYEP